MEVRVGNGDSQRPSMVAAELCRARGGDFRDELEAHLLHGYVFSTPEIFLMGRAVPRSAEMCDAWQHWPLAECDAWFVWVGVGAVDRLLAHIPYELPWLGWVRQGREWQRAHWLPLASVKRKAALAEFSFKNMH